MATQKTEKASKAKAKEAPEPVEEQPVKVEIPQWPASDRRK